MGRGKVTPDETIELIKATYAMNGSLKATSIQTGVPIATVSKYVNQPEKDRFESVRIEKRIDIIDRIKDAQIKLIDAMVDEAKLAKSTLHEIGVAFGIVTDKGLLLSGLPNSRVHMSEDSANQLTPEEMEQAALIRERFANAERVTT